MHSRIERPQSPCPVERPIRDAPAGPGRAAAEGAQTWHWVNKKGTTHRPPRCHERAGQGTWTARSSHQQRCHRCGGRTKAPLGAAPRVRRLRRAAKEQLIHRRSAAAPKARRAQSTLADSSAGQHTDAAKPEALPGKRISHRSSFGYPGDDGLPWRAARASRNPGAARRPAWRGVRLIQQCTATDAGPPGSQNG